MAWFEIHSRTVDRGWVLSVHGPPIEPKRLAGTGPERLAHTLLALVLGRRVDVMFIEHLLPRVVDRWGIPWYTTEREMARFVDDVVRLEDRMSLRRAAG